MMAGRRVALRWRGGRPSRRRALAEAGPRGFPCVHRVKRRRNARPDDASCARRTGRQLSGGIPPHSGPIGCPDRRWTPSAQGRGFPCVHRVKRRLKGRPADASCARRTGRQLTGGIPPHSGPHRRPRASFDSFGARTGRRRGGASSRRGLVVTSGANRAPRGGRPARSVLRRSSQTAAGSPPGRRFARPAHRTAADGPDSAGFASEPTAPSVV